MQHEMIETWLRLISLAIEIAGAGILCAGFLLAGVIFLRDLAVARDLDYAFHRLRVGLARSILLAIELLIASDLIGTVVVRPTLENLAVLAIIILIRTFLSFSLEVEIEGRWPWRRQEAGQAPGVDRPRSSPDAPNVDESARRK